MNCLLTDFGIAKIVEGASDKFTVTGGVVGTPSYMSPEQGIGNKLDGRSDIYALGVILYEMVAGQVPFRAETPMAVMLKHINDPLLPPRQFAASLPEAIERVILKALAKQPDDRYATASDMVQALEGAVAENISLKTIELMPTKPRLKALGETKLGARPASKISAEAPSQPAAARADSNQRLMIWGLASLTLVVLAGLIVLGLWLTRGPGGAAAQPSPPPPPPSPAEAPDLDPPPLPPEEPVSNPAEAPPADPPPTATPILNQPTPLPTEVPASDLPPADAPDSNQPPPPPQEAIDVCLGASQGATCEVGTPRGTLAGSCQLIQAQLACIPAGGPPGGAPPLR